MNRISIILAACFVTSVAVSATRADADAQQVINAAIKAAGGKNALAKFEKMTWKEEGTYYGMGEGLPYEGSYAVHFPGKFRMEIENVFTTVLDGDQGWVSSFGSVDEMTEEQIAEQKLQQHAAWVTQLTGIKGKDFELESIEPRKIGDSETIGVKVSKKGYRDVSLYFHKETKLLLLSAYTTKAPELDYKEVPLEVYLYDYKEIEGAKVATRVKIHQDGKLFIEAKNSDMKPVEKFDEDTFAKPE